MSAPDECLDWQQQRADFEADGSLRDIYVLNTTLPDWELVLKVIAQGPYGARLLRADDEFVHPVPEDPAMLFADGHKWRLDFTVGGAQLACHFFTTDEVEFDFWPNGLSEAAVRELLRFMARLGDVTHKRVVMTPENALLNPIYAYDPASQRMTWAPPG